MRQADVTVIGGGMSGMAASVHLARAGFQVQCIDSDKEVRPPVGESLDWSAPDLLKDLGLPKERLIAEGIATFKRHVILKLADGSKRDYTPSEWLGRPPYNVELVTLHVDRTRLDGELRKIVLSYGVKITGERAIAVETNGKRVTAVKTAEGARFSSPWFVDASGGTACLLPRAFHLPAYDYGPRKVAIWSYFAIPETGEGTTLHASGQSPYMDWIWEIPIRPGAISVGFVASGDDIKARRQQGLTIEEIFRAQLARFPRFDPLLRSAPALSPSVTSFQCRVHRGIAGPNWIVVGESASMVDPMTSNGVTAALRTAAEASELIIRSRASERLPRVAAAMYGRRVLSIGRFFNSGIEKIVYDSPVRTRIGALTAGDVYTIPAWTLNTVYARLRPRGVIATSLYSSFLGLFRAAAKGYLAFCKWRAAPVSGAN